MKRPQVTPILVLAVLALLVGQARAQSSTGGTNLTPDAPAAVIIAPSVTDMISIPTPSAPSFTTDTRSGTPASDPAGASGAASGNATNGNNPLNPDCAIAGSDDPANLSFDTIGCGQ
jgi:hypothetical protein